MSDTFRRETVITGAFDKRNPDPSKNYGVHGMEMRFYLIGPKGVVQFVFYSAQYLPHVADEFYKGNREFNPFRGMGADISYHSPVPMYEGQTARENCPLLAGAPCYYDGSGLAADEFAPTFLAEGSDAVWKRLEKEYELRFGGTT